MTPYYADPWLTVYAGDCRAVMAEMPAQSVHCVVTSPPYWGLRDYGTERQIGLESTPEAYVETMVAVFREVRRVLRDDGTVWLNLGDSYANFGGSGRQGDTGQRADRAFTAGGLPLRTTGLKPKDLVGIPWRVAFALQADGWYLRSDVVWSKPNPMPESVTDRPTKSHEYVFLLSKRERYYFDADAVRLPVSPNWQRGAGPPVPEHGYHVLTEGRTGHQARRVYDEAKGANIRSVWTIATQPYPGAHFATFPEALVEPCVKAGTSERGVCSECGSPWVRVVETERVDIPGGSTMANYTSPKGTVAGHTPRSPSPVRYARETTTTGWRPPCDHRPQWEFEDDWKAIPPVVPATVLDPFAGSGTAGCVAQRLGRRAVLIDLNPAYLVQAMVRNRDIPLGLGFGPTEDAA